MKWLLRLAIILVAAVVALLIYVSTTDFNQYKATLVELVEQVTKRRFSIAGDIRLKPSLVPSFVVEGIRLGNVAKAKRENMVTVERVEARIALLPLLRAQLVVKQLALSGAWISLEKDRRRRGNWLLELDESPFDGDFSAALPRLDIEQVQLSNTVVEYRGSDGDLETVSLDNVALRPQGFGQSLALTLNASYRDRPVRLIGEVSTVRHLLTNEPYVMDVHGTYAGLTIRLSGVIEEPLMGRGLNVTMSIGGEGLNHLAEPFSLVLPAHGAVQVSARVKDTRKGFLFDPIDFQIVDGSHGKGRIAVNRGRRQWRFGGALRFRKIVVSDFWEAAPTAQRTRMFPQAAYPLDWLPSIAGKVDLSIEQLDAPWFELTAVRAELSLEDGAMELEPYTAIIGDGSVTGSLKLDGLNDVPRLKLEISMRETSVDAIQQFASAKFLSGGTVDFTLGLTGAGSSLAAMMGGANGLVRFNIHDAAINNEAVRLAGADISSVLLDRLNPWSQSDPYTRLECAAVRFPIINGVARNGSGIGIKTDKLSVLGGGSIDLSSEQIDIGAQPKPREGLGLSVSNLADFVRLGGTLSEPTMVTDTVGAATAGLKLGAAVATAGLSILAEGLFDRLTADANVCAIARGEETIQDHKQKVGSDKSLLESTAEKTKDAIHGAGTVVRGVLDSIFGD